VTTPLDDRSPVGSALAETLPLTRAERRWSFLDVVCVKSGLAIATWAFLFGGATAQFVGFRDGILTMLIGNTIGVVLLLLALVLPSSKWGTEFFVHQRSVYGAGGAFAFVLLAVVAAIFAWASILATMVGKAAVEIARTISPTMPFGEAAFQSIIALAMLGLAWLVLVRGSEGVRLLNRVAAPGLLLLCIWLMVALFREVPLATVAAAPALGVRSDRATNIMLAIELNIACGVSWFALAANLGRYATTQRAAVWGSLIAYVPVNVLATTVGLTSALVLGSADPVTWMVPIVGPVAGVLLLLLLGLANLSSLVSMVQGNCQTLVQHLGRRAQSLGWPRFTSHFFLGVAAMVLLASDALYDRFFTIVAYSEALFASAIGVALADRVVLRRNRVRVRELYEFGVGGAYAYWARVNPVPFVALVGGGATYLLLLDPLAMVGTPLFTRLSATLPAVAVAFVLQVLLTRLIVIPAGKGDYTTP
jgi:NCS1 family nucleobase:cation symporter-1